jgi:polysaccharide deacetylase 2 family uncharacterized protein YibQ
MFAKRPAASARLASASAAPSRGGLLDFAVSHPLVGPGAAALVFVAGIATLVLVTADPNAGAPTVRVKLDEKVAEVSKSNGPGAFNVDGLSPTNFIQGLSADGSTDGQAVVSLPEGASLGGGQQASNANLPQITNRPGISLTPAPTAGLTEPSPVGPLPVIGRDGKTPMQAYARPFASNGKPKVALVVGGLGLNAMATRAAIEKLPPEITLSFVAYADNLQGWIDLARASGHEVLIEAPMEPIDMANNDPGPYALMSDATPTETVKRLEWILARATGYFGVTNYLGGKFLTSDQPMTAFMTVMRQRGLAFIDDGAAGKRTVPGLYRQSADAVIDADLTPESVQRQLLALEAGARSGGQALGSAFAYPLTLEVVARWTQGVAARGYQLAPVSALAHR